MTNQTSNNHSDYSTNSQSLLVKAHDNKYLLSEPVTTKQMYQLMLSLLEQEYFRTDQLTSPQKTIQYLQVKLAKYEQEVFCCIYLDTQHHVIGFEELFTGTLDSCSVYPRQIVKQCMLNNAAAVLFCHNHPSGDPSPSNADKVLTKRLQEALALIDIRVLDHIVIGGATSTSFAERGLI
jgi:DNA repair protein RadC